MIAATAGSTDILKCLVLAGADANVLDYVWCCAFAFTCILSSVPSKR
jgi:hypothetical protein